MRMPMKVLRLASRMRPDAVCFAARGAAENRIALTFDDGPHREVTPRILDVLAKAGEAATFFFQGDQARRSPSLVRDALAAGHQIASHGMQHISALRQKPAAVLDNALQGHATLADITGAPLDRDYRPPYGDMTLGGLRALREHGFRLIYWSYDSMDSFVTSAETLLSKLSRDVPPAGSILLFHDDCVHTPHALAAAVEAWRRQGFEFATVNELCAEGGVFRPLRHARRSGRRSTVHARM